MAQKHPNFYYRLRYLSPEETNVITRKYNYDGALYVDPMTALRFDCLRAMWGKPLIINSSFRSDAHNISVHGENNSMHKEGRAFDIRMPPEEQEAFIALARKMGFTGIGQYDHFVHLDDAQTGEFMGVPRPVPWDRRTKR